MRWSDGVMNTMDMSSSKLRKNKEAWHAAVHKIANSAKIAN